MKNSLRMKIMLLLFALVVGSSAWADETLTLTATNLSLSTSGSYPSGEQTQTVSSITFKYTDLMQNNSNDKYIQAKANTGCIYNSTPFLSKIKSVAITHSGTARSTTIWGSADGVNWTSIKSGSGSITGDFTSSSYYYFKITRGSNAAYWTQVVVTYETPHTLTYSANSGGSITSVKFGNTNIASATQLGQGVVLNIVAAASDGYSFDGWTATGTGCSFGNAANTTTTFTMGTTDCAITANFTASGPSLTVSPASLSDFTYSHGNGPSAAQTFSVSGSNLSANLGIAAPTDYELCTTENGTYSGSVSLTPADGTVSSTTIYVRLIAGKAIGTYNSEDISITSTGATGKTVTLSGTVTGYSVTYNGNGNTDGSVPTDNNVYEKNETVTVKSNSGSLVRTGYTFGGWNTKSDGTGTTYSAVPTLGTFAITENTTLYAKWNINSYNCSLTTTGETSHATIQLKNGDDVIAVPASIPYNTEITIDVTPESGYGYTYTVKDAGNNDVTVTDNKFNMPASAVTVTVNVSECYNITVTSPISYGSVSVVGGVTSAAPGTTISLTATPSTGYNLATWNVYKTDDESTKVTVTNNQFTMPSYNVTVNATFDQCVVLPYSWEGGGKEGLNNVIGASVDNVDTGSNNGSDYGSTHNPCNIKFDDTGDYILIKTNSRPGKVTVKVKMVGGSTTSTITIQESSNGSSFSDVADLTISGDQNDVLDLYTTNEFASTSRYVKFLFTKGSNVGVGPITIAKYSTDPEINADDTDIACDALSGSIEFTITRPVVGGVLTAEITDGNEGSWLSLTPGTYTNEVPFTCSANSADNDREATVTLTYTYNTIKTVTKEVTVTQGKRDYALLTSDFTFTGGKNDIENTVGLSYENLGTDYASAPKLKFTSDNSNISSLVLKLGEAPVQISYVIKGNSFSGGTFKVQVSADGSSYEDLAIHTTDISNTDAKTFKHICNNSTVRYIKWIYSTKSSGNVGLGNISVSKNAATITANTTLSETNIMTVGAGATLTFTGTLSCTNPAWLVVEEGGQLIVPAAKTGVQATFQRVIEGYSGTKDGYYLIANPTTTDLDPENDFDNMIYSGDDATKYDLFYFDESEEGAEWRNYKKGKFDLVNGMGYLYANDEDVTLEFAGTVPTSTSSNITLNLKGTGTYAGFNLVGNPMSVNITSMNIGGSACSYYKLDPENGAFIASEDPIIVGEAFMVEAPSNGAKLNLNPAPASKGEADFNNNVIRLEVSNGKYTDVAYLYFGNHLPLTKINHINDEAPMLYFQTESANQAVTVMNNRSEVKSINVNFEAKTMGMYTISAKSEKDNFSYMHLYDRLTGVDTDLLESDYTFIGSTTDSKCRFILRFEAVDTDTENEIFAYQSGNNIYVNGEGELQIFDITGRFVMSERINGATSINADALSKGVYVLRIVGSEIKTQKIVVR